MWHLCGIAISSFNRANRLAKAGFKSEAEEIREKISTSEDQSLRHEIRAFLSKELGNFEKQELNRPVEVNTDKSYAPERLREYAEAHHPWVLKFYPHTCYSKYSVILMSFAKFIGWMNTPFIHKQVIDCFPEASTAIIIDEFDSTKDVLKEDILKKHIRLDMNALFTRIHHQLKAHHFKSLNTEDKKFQALLKRAESIYQDYHLNCNYASSKNTETSYLPQKQKILFHDNFIFSPVDASRDKRYINAIYSPQNDGVEITYTQKELRLQGDEKKIKLTNLLRRMENFFVDLQAYIDQSAEIYQNKINAIRAEAAQQAAKKFYKKWTHRRQFLRYITSWDSMMKRTEFTVTI